MPVNSLFVAKEKCNFLKRIKIGLEIPSHIKASEEITIITVKDRFQDEIIIKEMIVVLEDIVKILKKKVHDLKKEENVI